MPRPATHLPPVQAIVKMVNAPQIVIARALCARGNLGEALPFILGALRSRSSFLREKFYGRNFAVAFFGRL